MWIDRMRPLVLAMLMGVALNAIPVTIEFPPPRFESTQLIANRIAQPYSLPSRPVAREVQAMAAAQEKVLATSAATTGEITLTDKPVRVVLAQKETSAPLGSLLRNLPAGHRLYLVLKGLSATQPPGVVYHLYLELPPGATPAENDPRYVGTFNFFNFVPLPDADRSARDASTPAYSFDVTDIVRTLQARGLLGDSISVTIVPGGRPANGAKAVIGEIALVEQ